MLLSQLKAFIAEAELTHAGQDPDLCFLHPDTRVALPVGSVYVEVVNIALLRV